MAQAFFLQGVLATEERSGFYGRGSMFALKGKGQADQGMPSAVCSRQALDMEPINVLKINCFSLCHQRPGEICGLGMCVLTGRNAG